jgi:hypothetical protein
MPDGYGIPEDADGLLTWEHVERRLRDATEYWMATTRPDGRPHVVPRWGVWVDGAFHYDGSPTTRHAQNLRTNASTVLHLESGTDVVILEGSSRPAEPVDSAALGQRLSAEFARKYGEKGYRPGPDSWSGADAGGLSIFRPAKALAWTQFPTDCTRFTFSS